MWQYDFTTNGCVMWQYDFTTDGCVIWQYDFTTVRWLRHVAV